MKKALLRIGQVVVTLAVLAWVFHDREMRNNIPTVLRKADFRWILFGVAVAGLGELSNIFRWQIFLRIQKIRIPFAQTAMVFMIGVFFNLFLFGATGGDVIRAAYLCADHDKRKPGVILSVVVDRLIGMVVLIPFGVAVVLLRHNWFRQTPAASGLFWFLVIFMVGMTAFFVFAIAVTKASKLPAWVTKRPTLVRTIEACRLFGTQGKDTLIAYALSVPVLFCPFVTFYCASRAFGAGTSFMDIFSIMPIVTIVTSFPISFSGIGVRESLFKNLLGDLAGIPAEIAVLISLAGFLSYISWSLVGAVIWIYRKPGTRAK